MGVFNYNNYEKYFCVTISFIYTYSFSQTGCQQQLIIPLRTHTDIPQDQCYYMKDTDNELKNYTGTWMGTRNNKTFYVTFKKNDQ